MRFLVAILVIWLFFFYNIERLSGPVNFTLAAYVLVPMMAVLIILIPRLHKVPLAVLLIVPVVVFLILKVLLEEHVWGATLPLTVTEACAIALTVILARWVSIKVNEFERAVGHIVVGQADNLSSSFSASQVEMYQELRRARRYHRPLALMSIGIKDESIKVALDRMVQEVQQTMMKRYVVSDVAKTLCNQLDDHDIIAHSNGNFLVLLPEATPEELDHLVDDLRDQVFRQVGVVLQIGVASFPGDAVTFDSLVEKRSVKWDKSKNWSISGNLDSLSRMIQYSLWRNQWSWQ